MSEGSGGWGLSPVVHFYAFKGAGLQLILPSIGPLTARSPSQLLVRNGPLKQTAKRATPLAANRLHPRRPGQRPLGLQRQRWGLLPQSLPHPHLTGAPPGTGARLETTQ